MEAKTNELSIKPPSKLKLPSKLPPSTAKILKDLEGKRPMIPLQARGTQVRRSKSFSDLRTVIKTVPFKPTLSTLPKPIAKKNPVVVKSNIMLEPRMVVNKSADKRLGSDKPKTDNKRKPTKPAPHDYKARFHLLLEKHTNVVQQKKDVELQLAYVLPLVKQTETIAAEMGQIRGDVTCLYQEIAKMKHTIQKLERCNEALIQQIEVAKPEVEISSEESEQLR